MRVDAHQHYWRPERGGYPWMASAPACLQRSFLPRDLAGLLVEAKVDATILVQAAPRIDETDYLLGIADSTASVAGVIGWIDFEAGRGRSDLDRLARHPRLLGVRPMVQDSADDDWVLRADIDWAFAALQEHGLVFEALGYPRHARRFLRRIERHPDLRVVIDHGMKPEIASGAFEGWASDMRDLASQTHVFCKLSGLATEAGAQASVEDFRPYVEHLVEVFGAERLMWGSDWPVSTSAIDYAHWLRTCESLLAHLDEGARRRVFGESAAEFYRLIYGEHGVRPRAATDL